MISENSLVCVFTVVEQLCELLRETLSCPCVLRGGVKACPVFGSLEFIIRRVQVLFRFAQSKEVKTTLNF